jgi:hypothetical protein
MTVVSLDEIDEIKYQLKINTKKITEKRISLSCGISDYHQEKLNKRKPILFQLHLLSKPSGGKMIWSFYG